ncbi:unnamed protein product, partial [Dicrocoelium dendriticum]
MPTHPETDPAPQGRNLLRSERPPPGGPSPNEASCLRAANSTRKWRNRSTHSGFSRSQENSESSMEANPPSSRTSNIKNGLRVILANVRSLRNKLDEIPLLITEQQPDLMAFTETWLSSDISDSEVHVSGYQLLRCDRFGGRSGGGVILYTKNYLKAHIVEPDCDKDDMSEMLWCRIHDGYQSLMVGVVYRAPAALGSHLLRSVRTNSRGTNCLLMGDFNAPNVIWDLLHSDLSPDSFEVALLDTVHECNLTQHVLTPTRMIPGQTPNILDLVLTSTPSDVSDLTILQPLGTSDQCTVSFSWTRRLTIHDQGTLRRNFWRTDRPRLRTTASNMDWSIPQSLELDDAWERLRSMMMRLVEQFVPNCKSRPPSKGPPWIDKEVRSLMKKRRKLWDHFKSTGQTSSYLEYKTVRNLCTLRKRDKRLQYEHRLAMDSQNCPKKLFAYLKRNAKTGSGIPALSSFKEGTVLYGDDEKANLLAAQYSSVYSVESPLLNNCLPAHHSSMDEVEINPEVVTKLLLELDPNSSPGPDGLHPSFLKTIAEYVAVPLCQVFRQSLEVGCLPTGWKAGTVLPKYKGGNKQDPANYRPICLTSVVCKNMERIVKCALQLHCEHLNLITPAQHGFRRARSCITNLLIARETWAEAIDTRKRVDVIFIDFSKAFDKVPHVRLLHKLQGIGITGNLLSWIADFLRGRTMRVQVNQTLSAPVPMTSGIPQGSVLGPELFKLYINDLPTALQTDCLIYADDLKLWSTVSSIEDVDRLQGALDQLHEWSIKWELPVNRDKCAVLPMGGTEPYGAYHIGGFLLRNTTHERDLGVIVTSDLRTTQDTLKKVATGRRLVGALRRSFARMTPEIFRPLFTSYVRPVLEYGLPASYPLSKFESAVLEKVQRRASKAVLGLRDLPYPIRLQKLNLFSLELRRRRGDLIYTRRILRGELGSELQQFFRPNTDCSTRGHTWNLFKQRRHKIRKDVTLSTRVVNDWNSLPEAIADAPSEESFKRLLDIHSLKMLESCGCHSNYDEPSRNVVTQRHASNP